MKRLSTKMHNLDRVSNRAFLDIGISFARLKTHDSPATGTSGAHASLLLTVNHLDEGKNNINHH